ncbi:MAG: undecaprenyl-diphosphate phosphatase [Candidatus Sumerlaeaceae bacterium]|nr:undecaprenyl-diphosphate phosphatase [Candidatus Sumerlaeaceae bacterium]
MLTTSQAILLGAVQGATEFLPISSSAHLIIVPWLLDWQPTHNQLAFDVALHFGTLLAVLIYFCFDWLLIVASYIGDLRQRRWLGGARGSLLLKIIVGTIPGAIFGKILEDPVEGFFYSHTEHIWVLAITLSVFAIFLIMAERMGKQARGETQITYLDALIIGSAQALAVIPGVSRSGITILAGLFLGLQRPAAARFSFLLATPIILGAVILKVGDLRTSDLGLPIFAGVASAALVGMAAIRFLLKYVEHRRYDLFAFYRWGLSALVLGVWYWRLTH